MLSTDRLYGSDGGTGEPYLGRHRKVPLQIRAALLLSRRITGTPQLSPARPGDASTALYATPPETFQGLHLVANGQDARS